MIRMTMYLWPALLPLALYAIWIWRRRAAARRLGQELPLFRSGALFWAVLASLLLAALCLIMLGLLAERTVL